MPTDCTKQLTSGDWHDPVNFFLIAAMTGNKMSKVIDNFKNKKHMVCLTINGVEVDFEHAVKRFVDNINEEVKKKALEIAEEKCSDIIETMNAVQKSIKKTMKKRLGIAISEDDWA